MQKNREQEADRGIAGGGGGGCEGLMTHGSVPLKRTLLTAITLTLLLVGIHESAKVNNFIVVVKVGISDETKWKRR